MITEKLKAFLELLKDETLVDEVLKGAEAVEKQADESKTAFKESMADTDEEKPEDEMDEGKEPKPEDENEDKEPEDLVIGDMNPSEFAELMATAIIEAIGKAMEPYKREVKELQNAVSMKDDQAAALKESQKQIADQIKDLQTRLKELEGEAPKSLKSGGYRASQDEETVVSDKSYDEPHVDSGFLEFMGGKRATQ